MATFLKVEKAQAVCRDMADKLLELKTTQVRSRIRIDVRDSLMGASEGFLCTSLKCPHNLRKRNVVGGEGKVRTHQFERKILPTCFVLL